ncbi:hypothetical protein [Robertmurraya andreesenii]|uniref:hypothetical protein n=1 Tax=Anoxybacillus andreesenii TaxID=1325932 RepID=UPI0027D776F5|nr:hypothetical protein [Robertmurraya andreesenii]
MEWFKFFQLVDLSIGRNRRKDRECWDEKFPKLMVEEIEVLVHHLMVLSFES